MHFDSLEGAPNMGHQLCTSLSLYGLRVFLIKPKTTSSHFIKLLSQSKAFPL